jgi:hypothetical protein
VTKQGYAPQPFTVADDRVAALVVGGGAVMSGSFHRPTTIRTCARRSAELGEGFVG